MAWFAILCCVVIVPFERSCSSTVLDKLCEVPSAQFTRHRSVAGVKIRLAIRQVELKPLTVVGYRRIPSTETFFILVLQVHQPCSVPIGKHAHCLIAAIGPHLKKPRIAVLQHGSSKFCSIRNRRHNPVDGDVAPHCACLLANYCGNPVAAIDVDVSKHAIGGLG